MARVSVLLFATVAAVVLAAVVAGEPRVHPDQVRSQSTVSTSKAAVLPHTCRTHSPSGAFLLL